MSLNCIEISNISKYLAKVFSKIPSKDQKFLLIDMDKNILYTPSAGYYECKNFDSLKKLIQKILGEIDIEKIFLSRGIDEKWIEQNIKLLIGATTNPNILMLMTSPRRGTSIDSSLLSRLVSIIPIKKKKLLFKKQIDPETIAELIELYSSILR